MWLNIGSWRHASLYSVPTMQWVAVTTRTDLRARKECYDCSRDAQSIGNVTSVDSRSRFQKQSTQPPTKTGLASGNRCQQMPQCAATIEAKETSSTIMKHPCMVVSRGAAPQEGGKFGSAAAVAAAPRNIDNLAGGGIRIVLTLQHPRLCPICQNSGEYKAWESSTGLQIRIIRISIHLCPPWLSMLREPLQKNSLST